MTEIRFSYNPFTKNYIESGCSHAVALYNKGKQKQFDEYIRGIILDDVLYLRTYYPFDLSSLTILNSPYCYLEAFIFLTISPKIFSLPEPTLSMAIAEVPTLIFTALPNPTF